MDPDLGRFPVVWAAAGTPTAVFPVPPATLRMLANAHVAPICEVRDPEPADRAEPADAVRPRSSRPSRRRRQNAGA